MKRSIEQYRNCDPRALATRQSEAAMEFMFADMKADILELYAERERVAALLAQWKTSLEEARVAEKRAYSTWEPMDWIEFRGENNSMQTRITDLEEAMSKATAR